MEKAKEYFDEAIERDPNYALAYVGLANCYYVLPSNAPVSHTEVNPKELAMAKRALSIDEALGEAHTALAGAYQDSWQCEDAARVYRKCGYQAALRQIIAREEELAVVSEFCSNYRRRGSGVVAPSCRSLLAESCVAADAGFGLWVRK